jgi:hypothetical protein
MASIDEALNRFKSLIASWTQPAMDTRTGCDVCMPTHGRW